MAAIKEINFVPEEIRRTQTAANSAETKGRAQRDLGRERVSTIITTEKALFEGNEEHIIKCWVNPSEFSWAIPIRGSLQKVRGGVARFQWRSPTRRTFYDELKVGMTFSSGNILPQTRTEGGLLTPSIGEGTGPYVTPPGLYNFYQFLSLLDEPLHMDDGRENFAIIVHTSAVFPQITLQGYFDPSGVSFSESAEGTWEVKWSCPFEVVKTSPKFSNLQGLQQVYGMIA